MLNNPYFLTQIINCIWNLEVFAENVYFSQNRNRQEHEILAKIVDNFSKSHRIRAKQVAFDSIRFIIRVHNKNMCFSLKYHVLYQKNVDFRDWDDIVNDLDSYVAM